MLSDAVRTGITSSLGFTEWEAFVAANQDPIKLDRGGYTPKERAKILSWYINHELVKQHKEAALAKDIKRKHDIARRAGR